MTAGNVRNTTTVLVLFIVSGVVSLLIARGEAASQSKSPVLKDPASERSPFYLKRDRSTEILFDAFMLVKKANGGDPVAEHELGLRYLQGDGFSPDTAKAAHWIGRAADRDYVPAVYNLGILKNNGWGTDWDPFGAYRNFRRAADDRMAEGMYMTGLFLTDNLVVRRDYSEAYRWISAAADSGYEYAKEVLADFEKTGIMTQIRARRKDAPGRDTSASTPGGRPGGAQSYWKPVFIELGTDTLADPDDSTIAREAMEVARDMTDPRGREHRSDPGTGGETEPPGSPGFSAIETAAAAGSPEALTLLGRRSEQGAGVSADRISAARYYLRAIRCESRWAPVLLWRLSSSASLYDELTLRAGRGDPEASYVWACLVARGFDRRLTEEQALDHLGRAARGGLTDAIIELAMWHYAGLVVPPDNAKGDSLMQRAAGLGSREAEIRLAMSSLRREGGTGPDPAFMSALARWENDGSVLAQVMLGYCYEGGRGVAASLPQAVAFYRMAAQRGSRIAYDLLRNLYDRRRPPGREWIVEDAD